jgi:hypothetical protein
MFIVYLHFFTDLAEPWRDQSTSFIISLIYVCSFRGISLVSLTSCSLIPLILQLGDYSL